MANADEEVLPLTDETAGDAGVLGQEDVHDSLNRGMELIELSDAEEEQAPSGPDDSPSGPNSALPRRNRSSVFDVLVHGPRVTPAQPHPPSLNRVEPVPRHLVAFRLSRDRNSNWPKVDHSLSVDGKRNYLRLTVTFGTSHFTCRAICQAHGGIPCSLTKSCKRHRPIGRMWAWLKAGEGLTREQHGDFVPSLEQRRQARREFESLDDISDFVNAECGGPGLGEPQETWV